MSPLIKKLYEFDEFQMDHSERILSHQGERVPLAEKPFETLSVLVRGGNGLITKDELLTRVWADAVVEENSLDKNISYLRRLFAEKNKKIQFIETVRGRGFRFLPEVREVLNEKSARRARTRQDGTVETIAVLPFKPIVAGSRDETLEMGMSDTLITMLSNNRKFILRPLSSVRKYGNIEQDAVDAGRSLEVDSVLDGSIQRSGDQIRVNMRLFETADGTLLWSGTFDEKFTNIFDVQDAISNRVATALTTQLSQDEARGLSKRYTDDLDAYQLYLKGRFQIAKLTTPESQKAISFFQQALELDPNYALAYVGLASAYRSLALAGELPSSDFLSKAKAAAEKAVKIDDSLADGHSELGFVSFWYDWDWKKAEIQDKRALELNPNSADAHFAFSHLLSDTGRHAEALREIRLAKELDPLNLKADVAEAQFLLYAGQPDEALAKLRQTFEIDPNYWYPHLWASSAYIDKQMYAEAISEAQKARELSGVNTQTMAFAGYAMAKAGKEKEAKAVLSELLEISTERYVPPYNIALVNNGLGNLAETLTWLQRGYDERDPRMVFLKVEKKWDNLRSDAKFIGLMRRMNL